MATTLTVSGLTDYIDNKKDELIVKASLGAKTFDYIEVMPNVKGKTALNYLDSTVVLADGSQCGFNPAGSDVLSERNIEVKPVKVEKSWCYKDFKDKMGNYQILWAAGREKLPYEEYFVSNNLKAIEDAEEAMLWQGDSGLSIDGFIELISGETDSTIVTMPTGSTISAVVDATVAAVPTVALKKGVNVFMSYTDFRAYVVEQNSSCCANRPVIDANVESLQYVGDSRVTLVPVAGLEGQDVMVAATKDALVYGTDVENADSEYDFWFDKKDEMFDLRVLWMFGNAVKLPDEVVLTTF